MLFKVLVVLLNLGLLIASASIVVFQHCAIFTMLTSDRGSAHFLTENRNA